MFQTNISTSPSSWLDSLGVVPIIKNLVDQYQGVLPGITLAVAFLASFAAYAGRARFAQVLGVRVSPHLLVGVVGTGSDLPPFLAAVERAFEFCGEFRPKTVGSGIASVDSLIHNIRNEVKVPSRVYTEANANPEYRPTLLYEGVFDKRLLVSQTGLGDRLVERTQQARSLKHLLAEVFQGTNLKSFQGMKGGGFLAADRPSISVLTTITATAVDQLAITGGELWLLKAKEAAGHLESTCY